MKGTPEQIRRAMTIKSKAVDRVLKLVKNQKTVDLIIKFADSKQDANWWLIKSVSGENFLITEHQKSISSDISNNKNGHDNKSDDHLKPVRLADFQLPKWIVDWLITQPESGDILIEKALIQTYQIKPSM